MLNIIVNLSHLIKGGGQNVGLNFLLTLQELQLKDNYIFLVPQKSNIEKIVKSLGVEYITFPSNAISRIIKEIFILPTLIKKYKINLVYTYFGFTVLNRNVIQICGNAVSNIFYPEIKFWSEYQGCQLFKRKLIDKYRMWGVKRAHGVIFENMEMKNRAVNMFGLDKKKVVFIRPSIFENYSSKNDHSHNDIKKNSSNKLRLLFLCGWQLNKNVMRIPEIALELAKYTEDFEIVLTAPKDYSKNHIIFERKVKDLGVYKYINHLGIIDKINLASLYKSIDIVLLLSKLESFSNNIIEAWFYKKPLLITDSDWSRSICKEAAFYVDRDNIQNIAKSVIFIANNANNSINKCILRGTAELKKYPTLKDKTILELAFIKKIYNDSHHI